MSRDFCVLELVVIFGCFRIFMILIVDCLFFKIENWNTLKRRKLKKWEGLSTLKLLFTLQVRIRASVVIDIQC